MLDDAIGNEQEIEIDRPRSADDLASSSEIGFDPEKHIEEGERLTAEGDPRRRVEEVSLDRSADGRGLVDRREGLHLENAAKGVHRSLHRRKPIAEVGAEPDDGEEISTGLHAFLLAHPR